jgi:hypothetical protein
MKYLLIFLMSLICSLSFAQKPVKAIVDPRVELFSIVFRLAGNLEYNMNFDKKYVTEIHSYFDKYQDHPLISFARQLSQNKNMGYSRVMFLAVDVQFINNKFSLIKESENTLAGKWDRADAIKFVDLLNDFYKLTDFNTFFNDHQQAYAEATGEFDRSITEFDQNWYLNYYGDHSVAYKAVIGLGEGGANYGPDVKPINQKKLVYAIVGSWTFDENGKPLYPKNVYLSFLIHEFNHSFIDYLLDADSNAKQLNASGEILLANKRNEMKREGYTDWQSVINESLVRASVIRYMMDHKQDEKLIQDEIQLQTGKGFIWTKNMVSLLGEYELSRSKYPTFKSFYPRIISFFDTTAHNLKSIN